MNDPYNDMILLLPLQEFMSLTSVQGKLCASTPCFIFYVDSLHTTWILRQVPPKLLCFSICIELMVALAPTIPQVSPPLSSIFTSALSVPSFDVVMVAPPLNLVMHPPMHYLIQDHATTPRCSLGPLSFVKILS
ncbi:hypothetical protein BHE74_00019281 [Ensete ventricosum]|nr:hypothetical protein GW17_00031327 [Ensete ventricosum]RWW72890.1 hypothetical protein BHE74_00019281 [Ensete ventricosum]RZR76571.1 hypothetical protein BHM03_00001396 [Ensete ventricosum]